MKSDFFDFLLFPAPEAPAPVPGSSAAPPAEVAAFVRALPEADESALEAFLEKVLQAAGLRLSIDVLLIRVTQGDIFSFSRFSHRYPLRQALIFGIEARDMGLHFQLPLYQPVTVGSVTFLRAHGLAEILEERRQGGREKAGQLWKTLQELFPKP